MFKNNELLLKLKNSLHKDEELKAKSRHNKQNKADYHNDTCTNDDSKNLRNRDKTITNESSLPIASSNETNKKVNKINPCDNLAFWESVNLTPITLDNKTNRAIGQVFVNEKGSYVDYKGRFFYINRTVASSLLPGMYVTFSAWKSAKGFIADIDNIEPSALIYRAVVTNTQPLKVSIVDGNPDFEYFIVDEQKAQKILNLDKEKDQDKLNEQDSNVNHLWAKLRVCANKLSQGAKPKQELEIGDLILIELLNPTAKFYDIQQHLQFRYLNCVCKSSNTHAVINGQLALNGLNCATFELNERQLSEIEQKASWINSADCKLNDLTAIPFFSIDNAESKDIDDLVYITTTSEELFAKAKEISLPKALENKNWYIDANFADFEQLTQNMTETQKHEFTVKSQNLIIDNLDNIFSTKEPIQEQSLNINKVYQLNLDSNHELANANLLVPQHTKYILGVAIADPSAYFDAQHEIMQHAFKQTSSFYLPDYIIHMLPNEAVELVSMLPNKDKPSVVSFIYFDEKARAIGCQIELAKVRNHFKLNYINSSDYIDGLTDDIVDLEQIAQPKVKHMLNDISRWYTQSKITRMYDNRSLHNDFNKISYKLDEQGNLINFKLIGNRVANEIISECMIFNNALLARFAYINDIPVVYITQDGINERRVKFFSDYLRSTDISDNIPNIKPYVDDYSIKWDYSLLKGVRSYFIHTDIYKSTRINRFLNTSVFTLSPGQHISLCEPIYLNVTSPIRRYLDYFNQYNIKAYLNNQSFLQISQNDLKDFANIRTNLKIATKEIISRLLANYYNNKIGEVFEARFTNITSTSLQFIIEKTGALINVNFNKIMQKGLNVKRHINNLEVEIFPKNSTNASKYDSCQQEQDELYTSPEQVNMAFTLGSTVKIQILNVVNNNIFGDIYVLKNL